MRSSSTRYGKGWTFVVCSSWRQTAERGTAVRLELEVETRFTASLSQTQHDEQEEPLGLLSAGLKHKRNALMVLLR